ncbi:RDD family protein [Roseomonas stagni]|uniref:RDD family protein n=1 Tax=Falsiroseomonas algicola TaxID=2716930 RepID=A0A6M1LV70_9PROT|nr:RDD family protein [Falsiroseomonas algicola]NGM24368.1 RDD family protein [Falsiroseomonas algicola]
MEQQDLAGFWRRAFANIIDLIWLFPLAMLLGALAEAVNGGAMSGAAELMSNVITGLVVLLFWVERGGTPGKLALGIRIIDAETGGEVPIGRLVLRYIGYLVSAIPLGLGYFWMLWDDRRQTWHDKIGGTLVVKVAR